MRINDLYDLTKVNCVDFTNKQIANKMESYCRYIKNGNTVGEFKVKNGSNHVDRVYVGIVNHIDFDSYFIFYRYEDLDENIYDYFHEKGCLGYLKNDCTKPCLFNPDSNEIIENEE